MKKEKHLLINLQAAKIAKIKKRSQQTAINSTLAPKQKKAKPAAAKLKTVSTAKPEAEVAIAVQTANLDVEFNNVDAGLSDFTATHNGVAQTIHESGTISFTNVQVNDTILINGDSAGSTHVKISGVKAAPMQMDFDAGQHINGLFLILP